MSLSGQTTHQPEAAGGIAETRAPFAGSSALRSGYIACGVCGRAEKIITGKTPPKTCARCGAALPPTGRRGLDAVWAWLLAGVIFYVPANVYPMLITSQFGRRDESSIVGGAIQLWNHHAYFIALIVLVASVVIPIAKFVAIGRLALAASGRQPMTPHHALHLYEVVEFIGRWSMIDVFVVAILAALVQMGFLGSLTPGPAAAFFALSVGATMLSARALDPRLIWDRIADAPEMKPGTKL